MDDRDILMDSMNDIQNDYIIKYAEKAKTAKSKPAHLIRTWCVAAACLAVILICASTLFHAFTLSGAEDPKTGVNYYFSSYDELCEILPDGSIMANIPNRENAEIEIRGVCPEGTRDFSDINNFSYLDIDVSYDDNTGVAISCIRH